MYNQQPRSRPRRTLARRLAWSYTGPGPQRQSDRDERVGGRERRRPFEVAVRARVSAADGHLQPLVGGHLVEPLFERGDPVEQFRRPGRVVLRKVVRRAHSDSSIRGAFRDASGPSGYGRSPAIVICRTVSTDSSAASAIVRSELPSRRAAQIAAASSTSAALYAIRAICTCWIASTSGPASGRCRTSTGSCGLFRSSRTAPSRTSATIAASV